MLYVSSLLMKKLVILCVCLGLLNWCLVGNVYLLSYGNRFGVGDVIMFVCG